MTLRFDRGVPPAVALALLGGALALLALLLPWFSLNEEALKTFMIDLMGTISQLSPEPVKPGELDAFVSAGMPTLMEKASAELVGYKAFRPLSVGVHALAAGGALFAALKAWSGSTTWQQQRSEFVLAAIVVAVRPVLALLRTPGLNEAGAGAGFADVTTPTNLFSAGPGIFLALFGSVLLLGAAFLSRDPEPAGQPEWVAPPATGAAAAPAAYMPGAPAAAAPAANYAQPASPYAQPVPTPYMPGGAYGEEGPSTLDRDSRLVRPNDPIAPVSLAAPAVPIMPVPAAITPLHDPAPVNEAPGSTYGLPAPQAPSPSAPTRSGSTAPPGFG